MSAIILSLADAPLVICRNAPQVEVPREPLIGFLVALSRLF